MNCRVIRWPCADAAHYTTLRRPFARPGCKNFVLLNFQYVIRRSFGKNHKTAGADRKHFSPEAPFFVLLLLNAVVLHVPYPQTNCCPGHGRWEIVPALALTGIRNRAYGHDPLGTC